MTDVWITIGVLAVGTVMIKAAGPLAVGGRPLSPPATRVISLLAPAVLAALVVVGTFAGPDGELDPRRAGRWASPRRGGAPCAPRCSVWSRRRVAAAGGLGWLTGARRARGGGSAGRLAGRPARLGGCRRPSQPQASGWRYGSRPVRAMRANTRALGRSVRRSVSGSYEKKPKRG